MYASAGVRIPSLSAPRCGSPHRRSPGRLGERAAWGDRKGLLSFCGVRTSLPGVSATRPDMGLASAAALASRVAAVPRGLAPAPSARAASLAGGGVASGGPPGCADGGVALLMMDSMSRLNERRTISSCFCVGVAAREGRLRLQAPLTPVPRFQAQRTDAPRTPGLQQHTQACSWSRLALVCCCTYAHRLTSSTRPTSPPGVGGVRGGPTGGVPGIGAWGACE